MCLLSELWPKHKLHLPLVTVATSDNLLTTNCCVFALVIKHRYICIHIHRHIDFDIAEDGLTDLKCD